MRRWIDDIFESPAHVRIVVTTSKRPLAEYAPAAIREP
jgi:hypothetical protein